MKFAGRRVGRVALIALWLAKFASAETEREEEVAPIQPLQELFSVELVYPQERGEIQITIAPAWSRDRGRGSLGSGLAVELGITDSLQPRIRVHVSRHARDKAGQGGPEDMSREASSLTILVADDDPDDRMMSQDAFRENRLANDLRFVEDGEELTDYLSHRGRYSDPESAPRPALILLDLNMPKKDGREALREIKENPVLRGIPIVVLTTSRADTDICRTYDLGVNSFITKPVTFPGLVEVVRNLGQYWFQLVSLPDLDA